MERMNRQMISLMLILLIGLIAVGFLGYRIAYTKVQAVKTQERIMDLSPKDAFAMMEEGNRDLVILDVRTPKEFATGHIKNAINLDYYSRAFEDELRKLSRDKTYLIYCQVGGRSKKTLELMKRLGFQEVYNISGGIVQWEKDGLPIVK